MMSNEGRERKRERERQARARRAANIAQMRHTCDALECVLLASLHLEEDDAVWEDLLGDRELRVRQFLRQSVRLTNEANELLRERALLDRLLEEHRLSARAFSQALRECPANDWELKVARWRELARSHYVPWTLDEAKGEIEKALKEVSAFDWSLEKETTGVSLLGWREQRRIDTARNAFQFQFHKTYQGFAMMDAVNVGWDMYTEPKTFHEAIVGRDVLCFHEVLQQLGPNIVIVWGVARRSKVAADVHMSFLVCRVQTENGILQCVRSIMCPELVAATTGPSNLWTSTFMWKQWARLDREDSAYTYRMGGSIVGKDPAYLKQWMLSIFGCVLRSERLSTVRQLITSDESSP